MSTAVKKTISLPAELAEQAQAIAREENKSLSAVVQDALRVACAQRLEAEYRAVQDYWSHRAQEQGLLTEEQLDRHLAG